MSAGLAGSVLDVWGVLEPLPFVDHLAVNAVGAAVLAAGAVFALVAQAQMSRSWRAGIDMSNDYELITRGLFGIVRHPFYAGSIAASAGVFLMVPNLVTLAGWAGVLMGCEIDVRLVEEPHLHATHGDTYADYAERSQVRPSCRRLVLPMRRGIKASRAVPRNHYPVSMGYRGARISTGSFNAE